MKFNDQSHASVEPQNLLIRLFEYIEEQTRNIDPRGFNLSRNTGFQCTPADIMTLPGIEVDLKPEGDHIWLRIHRLEYGKPPKASPEFCSFLIISSNPFGSAPTLNEPAILYKLSEIAKIENVDIINAEVEFRTSVGQALQEYLAIWNAWAEGEKPRRRTIELYGDLFALKYQMEAEETAKPVELVWGIGTALWRLRYKEANKESNYDFSYPLLTQAVEISLDENSMSLEIRPRIMETRVEFDAFIACSIPGAADVEKAAKEHILKYSDTPINPFDSSSYSDVLKLIATHIDSKGFYQENTSEKHSFPNSENHLVITDSWVIFSRPRNNHYLVEDLHRLIDKIQDGCELPAGPLALISPPSDIPIEYTSINFRGISSRGNNSEKLPQELYFPLPYNTEQITILQRLEKSAGVTVQGPPGTGKTHTIANIICHYLATGKRVLVTAQGEAALSELQSKIPKEIQSLSVALLTNDREGTRQFQSSIESIQHHVSQLNPENVRKEIEISKQAIDRAHSELSQIDNRVNEIAIAQLSEIEVDGIVMRAQKMATLVVSGQNQYEWFDDELSLSPENTPPLSEEESGYLREARRVLGDDLIYVNSKLPSFDQFPPVEDIIELHTVLCKIDNIDGQEKSGELLSLKSLTADTLDKARRLLESIDTAKSIAKTLESTEELWPFELRAKCRKESFKSEKEALEALFEEIEIIVSARAAFLKRPVEISELAITSIKSKLIISKAADTGRPFRVPFLNFGEKKEHISTIRIAGLLPNGKDDWNHIKEYIQLHEKVISFLVRWNQFADLLNIPKLEGGVSSLRIIENITLSAKRAHRLGVEIDTTMMLLAEQVFEDPPIENILGGSKELELVRSHLMRHLTRIELSKATTLLSVLQDKLTGCSGPVSDSFRNFIENEIGNDQFESHKIRSSYLELLNEIRRISALSQQLSTVKDLATQLENSGAIRFASRIRTIPTESFGEDIIFPIKWRDAWNWARIKSYLAKIEARTELIEMAERRIALERGLSRLYKDMVSKSAWLATKKNASPKVLQALAGYATAIRRIGQGTGPNALRYRRDARLSMQDAAGSVPCWIMKHSKISESMPADIGVFDLVIVDEASQSDLWALPAIVRGKKILVVGDDKQVSPDGGFKGAERIIELRNRFLADQPYGIEMTPEKSLYDLAARVFAAQQVMLREHFRCVPPIIAYSNNTFYKGGIQPLRIPKASERIDPPLVDIYVENGYRTDKDCNRAEALAIRDEIEAILKNDQFKGRTIGVVSLLGMEQAKYIDSLVREACSATELLNRKFKCGDARSFQGGERDIMFLSMVVDSANCKALSGNMFDQRFNVAASRARDRMYLVRSVKSSDLSEKDLRLTLLSHFEKPFVSEKEDSGSLIDLCESGFEKEVFSYLVKKGYRVIPQVKSGAYRIDMVVEGLSDARLAIECDGDEYHGPDKWEQDMTRQRILERAGWTFWRCFASTWVLHKEVVFNELLEYLTTLGIDPVGALDKIPSYVEKRIFKPSTNHENDLIQEAIENAVILGDQDAP